MDVILKSFCFQASLPALRSMLHLASIMIDQCLVLLLTPFSIHRFPASAADLIRRLLKHDATFRLGNLSGGVHDIMDHPMFKEFGLDWGELYAKRMPPPHKPKVKYNNIIFHALLIVLRFVLSSTIWLSCLFRVVWQSVFCLFFSCCKSCSKLEIEIGTPQHPLFVGMVTTRTNRTNVWCSV